MLNIYAVSQIQSKSSAPAMMTPRRKKREKLSQLPIGTEMFASQIFIQYEVQHSVHHLRDLLFGDDTLLLIISADAEICIAEVLTLHLSEESLVVGNDNELEIGLGLACLNDRVERFG